MRKPTIAIVARADSGAAGGVQSFIIGLVSGLSRLADGDEDYVVVTDDASASWLAEHVAGPCRLEVTTSAIPKTRSDVLRRRIQDVAPRFADKLGDIPLAWRLALPRLAASNGTPERLDADLVHFTTQEAFLTKIPSIYQPHDLQHVHLPQFFTRRSRHLRNRNYGAFCRQATMVAVASSWTRDDVIRQFALDPERVRVVPYAPPTSAYAQPTDEEIAAVAVRRSLPSRFVFYPAQTWPHKNHAALLEALALLKRERRLTVPLVCSGHLNEHFAVLERQVRALHLSDDVRFLGFVTPRELQALYRRCAAVVVPSLFEAGSFPIWEAFIAEAPVACSSVTSLPAQANGAALVFDPRSPAAIADAVARLWTDDALRRRLVALGCENVARFSWDRTARHFRAHYRRLLGRGYTPADAALVDAPPLL
jgi:glycosyltransferase involved in cell wall biosynthesis